MARMDDKEMGYVPDFWMEDEPHDLLMFSGKTKRKIRTKKMEFVGWGSRPLIDFLESISKDTSKKISHLDVTAIVNDYVKINNLTDPHKKKRVLCDERLHSLFGKKSLARIKIHEFLGKHFTENRSDSDDDFFYSSEENDERTGKRRKASLNSNGKGVHPKKRIQETPKSCFATIIPANIKLLYLKRTLVQELYKDEETFEKKLVGSFVRIKSDPNDYLQKNSHQLVQVTGVKRPMGAGATCSDIWLKASNIMDDVRICMLSDENFSEEECEDLGERIKSGSLQRPTTVEFQQKAELLHEDITKHWLERELHLLQNLIDRANEKGWRKELFEHLDRRQLLQTPAEQKRLLLDIPKVIADELEHEDKPKEGSNDSPRPTLRGSSLVSTDDSEATRTLATQDIDKVKALENQVRVQLVETEKAVNITEIVDIEKEKEEAVSSVDPQQQKRAEVKILPATQVVELSDDDDEKEEESRATLWHYVDPQGTVQGPFSLEDLKRWSDAKYFPPDFKVFQKTGNASRILLSQLLLSKNL